MRGPAPSERAGAKAERKSTRAAAIASRTSESSWTSDREPTGEAGLRFCFYDADRRADGVKSERV